MKHEPDRVSFIQADLNKVVTGPQSAKLIGVISSAHLWMFGHDCFVTGSQRLPYVLILWRDLVPGSPVAATALVRPPVWHGALDGTANTLKAFRQIARIQVRLCSHHSASDIDADSSWDDRRFGGNDASNSRSDSPMHIGHGRNPFVYKRHLRHIKQLLSSFLFQRNALCPSLDGYSVLGRQQVVVLFHCVSFRAAGVTASCRVLCPEEGKPYCTSIAEELSIIRTLCKAHLGLRKLTVS